MPRPPLHDRLFRLLLRLFPSEFRGDFGDDMRADFNDQRRDAEGRPRELRRLWLSTIVDTLRRAPREHLDVLTRDVTHGLRLVRRHPVPALTAILSLAIGIGLNSAVFSVVSGVLWRGLPVPDGDRLVVVNEFKPSSASPYWLSTPAFAELQRQTKTLDRIVAGRLTGFNIVEPIEPAQVGCFAVSERFFDVVRVAPRLGRAFTSADYESSIAYWANQVAGKPRFNPVPHVMILSHDTWQRRFLGDADIVGKRVRLSDGDQVEIVGVMGPEMNVLGGVMPGECWIPEAPDPEQGPLLMLLARVSPGRSIDEANAELKVISDRLPAWPYSKERGTLRAQSVLHRLTDHVRTQLTFLFGAVVCVLLVTCANVVNLFLAHAAGRRDEMATRVALGASRGRLVRQTLTESLIVSSIGGACGLALVWWGVPLLVSLAPPNIPRLKEIHVDWSTLGFTAAISCAVGALCGLLALMPTRHVPRAVFGAVRASFSPRASRFRQGLTVFEIALALMLAVAATLMVRTVRALGEIELGFDPSHVVVADLSLGFTRGRESGRQFQMDVIERVKALPGVRAAGIGGGPLSGGGMFMGDVEVPGDARRFNMRVDAVSPGYFEALGSRLVAGRFFEARDASAGGAEVILVNEAAVREMWGGASPIGKSIFINKTEALNVIGVVADSRGGSLEEPPEPAMYQLSIQSRNFGVGTMVIRVDGDPEALVPQVRAIIRSLSRNQPFRGVTPMQERIDRSMAPKLFALRLIGLFSVIGLVLAVVGVYGVLAEFVAQRVPEIGVRMAFGATAIHVLRLILGQGLRLVLAGVVLGVGGAVLLRGAMKTMVYSVGTLDPLAYITASVFLIIATIAACSIPARRASRLDPAVALRE